MSGMRVHPARLSRCNVTRPVQALTDVVDADAVALVVRVIAVLLLWILIPPLLL